MVAWGAQRHGQLTDNSWDIYARSFSSAGVGGTVVRVNSHLYGDQYAPRISAIGADYLIVWTSLGQDGSREGVFGQFVHEGWFAGGRRISCEHHDGRSANAAGGGVGWRRTIPGGLDQLYLQPQQF